VSPAHDQSLARFAARPCRAASGPRWRHDAAASRPGPHARRDARAGAAHTLLMAGRRRAWDCRRALRGDRFSGCPCADSKPSARVSMGAGFGAGPVPGLQNWGHLRSQPQHTTLRNASRFCRSNFRTLRGHAGIQELAAECRGIEQYQFGLGHRSQPGRRPNYDRAMRDHDRVYSRRARMLPQSSRRAKFPDIVYPGRPGRGREDEPEYVGHAADARHRRHWPRATLAANRWCKRLSKHTRRRH
jgi:hypothetical protein